MPVTPSQPNVTAWDEDNTVELDVSVKMTKDLVDAGVGSFALCGTTGEGWALSLDEKKSFVDTVLQVVGHRVPVFAGATQLGTKATINEMRAFRDLGAEGAFVGLPLWQTPTMENSVRFLADLSEAVPDMPIMLYANSRVFKWDFPTDFWEAVVGKAPTVIVCKIAYGTEHLAEDVRLAGHQIRFLPNDRAAVDAYRQVPDHVTAINTGTTPARYLALRNGNMGLYPPAAGGSADAERSSRDGGWQIEYTDEDRKMHELFEAELAKNGAPCRMKAFVPWCKGEVGPTSERDT